MTEIELEEAYLFDLLADKLPTVSVVPCGQYYVWGYTDKGFTPRLENKREYIYRRSMNNETSN